MENKNRPQEDAPHNDIPADGNPEKQVNLLDIEEKPTGNLHKETHRQDGDTDNRQREWQQGIEDEDKALKPEEGL